jgi:hypothetical protein
MYIDGLGVYTDCGYDTKNVSIRNDVRIAQCRLR